VSNPTSTLVEREERLEEAMLSYLHTLEAGQRPDQHALLERYPDLADELAAFFADQEGIDPLLAPFRSLSATATLPGVTPWSFRNYLVLQEIGRGGMGRVYQARQVQPPRIVALKIIRDPYLADAGELERFRRDPQYQASLDHPHIVPIYEVGEHEGVPYFSMKLMEGGSLAQHMDDLRLPTLERKSWKDDTGTVWSPAKMRERQARIAGLVETLARAVHHAHQRSLLHRDLKPIYYQ
jgi:serine/threonine protein kinase